MLVLNGAITVIVVIVKTFHGRGSEKCCVISRIQLFFVCGGKLQLEVLLQWLRGQLWYGWGLHTRPRLFNSSSFIRGCPLGLPGTRSRRRVHVSPSAAPFASPRRYEHSSKLHLLSRSSPRRRAGAFPVFCVFLGLHTWNPQCYLKQ